MKVYDFLFYKSYKLAIRSKNFDDMPALGGVIFVVACLMFNIFTVFLVLEGFEIIKVSFEKKYKYPLVFSLVILILIYYLFKDNYKRIIKKYEDREKEANNITHPIFVIIGYYVISFCLMLLAGLFKNGDWIFS
jgi:NADH:ubiquinone oxidoreductase subunit 6 (subunit J)